MSKQFPLITRPHIIRMTKTIKRLKRSLRRARTSQCKEDRLLDTKLKTIEPHLTEGNAYLHGYYDALINFRNDKEKIG